MYENDDCPKLELGYVCVYSTYHDDHHKSGRAGEKHLEKLHWRKQRSSSRTQRSESRSPKSRHHRRRSRSGNRSAISHIRSSSRSGRSGSRARLRSNSRSGSQSREARAYSPDVDYKMLDRKSMVYATSLAAELRKRRMRFEVKMAGDVKPRAKVNWSQSVAGCGSVDEPVIIIDDLSSPEDEANPSDLKSMKDADAGSNKDLLLEPDSKKQKMESSDVAAGETHVPPSIVDCALLSSIPMPSLPPTVPAVTVEQKCSPVVEEKLPEERLSPVPTSPQEQHSAPVDELTTYPASVDQTVINSVPSYAFRRLTELPMPPVAPDDECESPSEISR